MPYGKYLNADSLLQKIKSGELSESKLDDKVRRILRVMFTIGLFDDYKYDSTKVNTDEHKQVALNIAKDGIVLLKNDNSILPIDLNKIKSIAVVGPNSKVAVTGGGGSSMVIPFTSVSPLEALQNKIGDKVKINFAQGTMIDGDSNPIETKSLFVDSGGRQNGMKGEYFTNKNLEGEPAQTTVDQQINFSLDWNAPFGNFPKDNFSIRWTGYLKVDKTDKYTIDVASDDGIRLYLEDKLVIDDWKDHAVMTNSYTTKLEAGKYYKLKLEYYENVGGAIVKLGWRMPNEKLLTEAINAAKKSDVAVVFAGTNANYESEGFDRKNLILPNEQDQLIKEIVKANPNTVIVLTTGSPVLMNEWVADVPGIIEAWFPGEQAGNAIAEILLGETNPSGKLPMTFPQRWEDCSAFNTYMKEDGTTRYEDGIYVGYRHFEKNKIKPLFSFGYGLSYTTFEFGELKLSSKEIKMDDKLSLSFKLKNTGNITGAEVVQLYVKDLKSSIDRPEKELKRFKKVNINPGKDETVEFELDKEALSYFDSKQKKWIAEPGEFEILIGSSSDNIKLKEKFILK
jgi:beta-glucosidase